MPRLSVLLPCRNAAPWLTAATASLERQTCRDFEVVVVDDGSTDDSPELLAAWVDRDTRVRVISPGRVGLVEALGTAARHATGEILARMDADDIAHSRRFETQLAFLDANPHVDACGSRIRYFPRRSLKAGALAYERWINGLSQPADVARDMFVECPIAHPTLMVRRPPFEAAGGYRASSGPEDYDLIIRLWRAGGALANVPRVLLAWRDRPDRTSRVDPRYAHAAFRRLKVATLLSTLVGSHPVLVAGTGPTGKAFARELVRQGGRLAAFVDVDPRKIGQVIHDVEVVSPARVAGYRHCFGIGAVSGPGARADVRRMFAEAGFTEGSDFVAVA